MSLIGGHNLNFRKLIFLSVGIVGVFATSGFISNVYADGNFLSACGHFNTIPDRPIAYPTTTGVFADFCSINPIMIQPPDPPLPDLPLPPAPYVMSGTIIAGAHPDGPGLGLSQNIIVDGGSPVGTPLHYRNGEIIITSTFDFANSFKSRGLFIVEPNARVDVFAGGKSVV